MVFILLHKCSVPLKVSRRQPSYASRREGSLALSLVLECDNDAEKDDAVVELSIVLKTGLLDDFVFPLARAAQREWAFCIHRCAKILEGVEICENTPGT